MLVAVCIHIYTHNFFFGNWHLFNLKYSASVKYIAYWFSIFADYIIKSYHKTISIILYATQYIFIAYLIYR